MKGVQGYLTCEKTQPIGSYRRPVPRVLGSWGGPGGVDAFLWARCPCKVSAWPQLVAYSPGQAGGTV